MATKPKTARAIHANKGVEAWYRNKLQELITQMHDSIQLHIEATYKKTPPIVGFANDDADPNVQLRKTMKKWGDNWRKKLDRLSSDIARQFAKKNMYATQKAMMSAFKDAGFTVKFKPTPGSVSAYRAVLSENVNLIKSIPDQYLKDVESSVWQSVMKGGDLHELTKDLKRNYGISQRRAEFIARDQNNKAKAIMENERRKEIGIKKAIWLHSSGGKEPRPTHVAMNGKAYDLKKGMYDSAVKEQIWPGVLPNCLPAQSTIEFADSISKAYRRWYCGKLTEIVTESGKTFHATPNHPVLTPNGWIAISLLNEGDAIIEIPQKINSLLSIENAKDHAVTTISGIFRSLAEINHVSTEVTARDNFHGDGIPDGNVKIVWAARSLSVRIKALRIKQSNKLAFAISNISAHFESSFLKFLHGAFLTSNRIMCSLGKSATFLFGSSFHSFKHGIGTIPLSTTSNFDSGENGISGNAIFSGKSEYAYPAFMFSTNATRIIKCRQFNFAGHVYNLETKDGWYVSNGIVTHNCRCTSQAIIPGLEDVIKPTQ